MTTTECILQFLSLHKMYNFIVHPEPVVSVVVYVGILALLYPVVAVAIVVGILALAGIETGVQ